MIRAALAVLTLAVSLASASPSLAVNPDERLADPALEARAREISRELRCLVCQNQSIDDSDAELARDLRRLVRNRLAAGDSNADVMAYVVSRYGDFVLMRPPVKPVTWVLWFGPAAVALGGLVLVILYLKRRRNAPSAQPQPLTEDEATRLRTLVSDERR